MFIGCFTNRKWQLYPVFYVLRDTKKEKALQNLQDLFAVRTRPHFVKILPVLSKAFLHK